MANNRTSRPRRPRIASRPRRSSRRAAPRRGVILLVILTVLVLFTLVAVTFVLVATQEYKTARADWKAQLYDDEHDELIERVMLQVVRGTDNPISKIGFHSLLEDMYANDRVIDFIATPTPPPPYLPDPFPGFLPGYFLGGGAMMFIDVPLTGRDRAYGAPAYDDDGDGTVDNAVELGYADDYKLMNGYYNGRVITMLEGPAAGKSTRIVGYLANNSGGPIGGVPDQWGRLLMQPFEGMAIDASTGFFADSTRPFVGDAFLINGHPYNGTGAGFNWATPVGDPYAGLVNAADDAAIPRPFALLPFAPHPFNPSYAFYYSYLCGPDTLPGVATVDDDQDGVFDNPSELGAPGSDDIRQLAFDEDYDAVDYQNMMLAARMWNPDPAANRWEVVLPSLVRPDLVRYWVAQYVAAGYDLTAPAVVAELMSRIYPRPLQIVADPTSPFGHPNFTGNPLLNLNLDTATDSWPAPAGNGVPDTIDRLYADFDGDGFPDAVYDVDNDGDGRPDSVWADIGLPVQTLPDGRIVKPLAALLVLDMDGRLNVNAHGNVAHYGYDPATGEFYLAQNEFIASDGGPYAYTPPALGGTGPDAYVPRPIGSGYSVGDVSLAFALPPPYPGSFPDYFAAFGTGNTINEYRQLLQGRPPLDLDGDGTADVPAIPGRYGEEYMYYLDGEFLEPISGGDATVDWIDSYIAAGAQVPMPGITSTGPLPAGGSAFPGPPGGDGWDDTAGTYDDLYDGDDNKPAAPGAGMGASFVYHWSGNYYLEGFLPGFAIGTSGSPGDQDGNGGLLLDLRGQPYYHQMGDVNALPGIVLPEGVDEHAELDLSLEAMRQAPTPGIYPFGTRQQIDQPFTPGEQEFLLRYFDLDARSLPNRIGRLAPSFLLPAPGEPAYAAIQRRGQVTTDSWDLPSPAITPTPELRELFGPAANNLTIQDLLAARLIAGLGFTIPLTPAQGDIINDQLAGMLSPDLAAGLRLDLNRPLGNGLDDDGDGVVDDPDEAIGTGVDLPADLFTSGTLPAVADKIERLWIGSAAEAASPTGSLPFDNNNDGYFDSHDMQARQNLARQLYVLMMLLKDSGFHHPAFESGLSGPTARTSAAPYPFGDPANPITEHEDLTARRIAQWCINVVDFRDRDSIMTPFEYDVRPFEDEDGDFYPWDVDGWVGVNPGLDGIFGTGDDVAADDDETTYEHRRMVWGCEQPDLLLTEATSIHDRRVEDLSNDNGDAETVSGTDDDDDFDQQRIPQGSAFIELYCCRNPGNPAYLGDLYLADGQLNLGKMAPPDEDGDASPVWRLAVTESVPDDADNNVFKRLYGDPADMADPDFAPDSTTLQPERMNLFDPADDIDIERIVWFAPYAPTNSSGDAAKTAENDKIYYNRATAGSLVTLPPGSYAVVGPRRPIAGGGSDDNVTVIGFEDAGDPEPQRIQLGDSERDPAAPFQPVVPFFYDGGGVDATYPGYPTDGTSTYPDIKIPLGIAVAGDRAGWADGVGFSISEPLFSSANYYPIPNGTTNTTDPHDPALIWDDLYDADPAAAGVQSYDLPFDNEANAPLEEDGEIQETGTTENYKTVLLQRLANPVWPWNPEVGQPGHEPSLPVNPYITVDFMPIDLTVFNGQEDSPAADGDPDQDPAADPDDPMPDGNLGDVRFASRQRGEDNETDNVVPNSPRQGTTASTFNLWSPISVDPPAVADPAYPYTVQTMHNFGYLLDHTLGYLNLPYQDTGAAVGLRWFGNPDPYGVDDFYDSTVDRHTGDPVRPFAWLTWNNRPYASAMELLMVPSSSPQRLLYEHDVRRTSFTDHYAEKDDTGGDGIADEGPPYNHLLHFLLSASTEAAYDPTDPATAASNFHRLFELVTVPSRMSGTEEMLDPVAFTGVMGAAFHPPFNRLSRYRDPGRINLNTIFDDGAIMRGLTNDFGNSTASNDDLWEKFSISRRGYDVMGGTDTAARYHDTAENSPTIFANPFRSFGGDYNVPLDALRNRQVEPTSGTSDPRDFLESSMFRPDPDAPERPLFAPGAGLSDTSPWTTFGEEYRNANRNPYFRYQLLQKMGNTVTTRSHVYAIWITVGYFETERITPSAQHPEGFRFGREVGSDTGEIRRHRGFYLFDRSIPVAFERGQNHNVHRALLIERVIE